MAGPFRAFTCAAMLVAMLGVEHIISFRYLYIYIYVYVCIYIYVARLVAVLGREIPLIS